MHRMQCGKEIGWDERFQSDQLREWVNICKQLNSVPEIPIKRFVGQRDDPFKLVAYCDASKDIYGVVLYILSLRAKEVIFFFLKIELSVGSWSQSQYLLWSCNQSVWVRKC